jgi:nucleoside-diphosphate-sugar epimerase
MLRWGVPIVPGDGTQLVQPLHIDDLIDLIASHKTALVAGLYPVGGAEALPVAELVATVGQILGLRCPVLSVPEGPLRLLASLARFIGVRPDQVRRLTEPKTVDLRRTLAAFDWLPSPLGLRLEQAVREAKPIAGGSPPQVPAQGQTEVGR